MRTLLILAASTLLHAGSFTSVSITSGDCPTQTEESATGGLVSVDAACFSDLLGGVGSNGSASAAGSHVSFSMHSVDGYLSP